MATRDNRTPKIRRKSAATFPPAKRLRRASQRNTGVSIDLAEPSLRDLMIEQCRDGADWITVYRGSRTDLVAARIPEAAFPSDGVASEFQVRTLNACNTGSREKLNGSIGCIGADCFEMEIYWKHPARPYVECSHPAIAELARMMLIDAHAWIDLGARSANLAYPMDMVAADPRAVDYKPRPGAARLQVTEEFHHKLRGAANYLYDLVYTHCEVLPCADKSAVKADPPRASHLRLMVDNTVRP